MKTYKEDNRPSFQFYPDDWISEASLKLCSLEAKGLWIEMLMIMFSAEKRGSLTVNGIVISSKELAKLIGEKEDLTTKLLNELEKFNVFTKLKDGLIINRRMYYNAERKEKIHEIRVEAGRKGGSSKIPSKKKPKQAAPTSSSTSIPSSFTKGLKETHKGKSENFWQTIEQFISFRKKMKKPMTEYAVKLLIGKLEKLSREELEQIEIMNQSIMSSWLGVFPLKDKFSTKDPYGECVE